MKDNENKDNSIAKSITKDDLYKDSKDLTPNHNQEFEFEIAQEFLKENKKRNLVKHRHKLAPYTKIQRKKRRHVSIDTEGKVFVVDRGNKRIQVFAPLTNETSK